MLTSIAVNDRQKAEQTKVRKVREAEANESRCLQP
jgi:hypothetical protein